MIIKKSDQVQNQVKESCVRVTFGEGEQIISTCLKKAIPNTFRQVENSLLKGLYVSMLAAEYEDVL